MRPEDFGIVGGRYLECPIEGCDDWEAIIGCRDAGDDLGSLLDAARDHLTSHETCQPDQPAPCGDYHNAGQCLNRGDTE